VFWRCSKISLIDYILPLATRNGEFFLLNGFAFCEHSMKSPQTSFVRLHFSGENNKIRVLDLLPMAISKFNLQLKLAQL